jgi:predicted nucleic acid-binding protein
LDCTLCADDSRSEAAIAVNLAAASFLAGLALYERRPDKQYSLADCISMNIMRQNQIQEVLTHDRHFSQEGFIRLLDRPV